MGCRIERCRLDELDLRHARITDTLLADNDATSVNAAEGTWRDSILLGGRVGALTASSATWSGVRLRGIKLDFLDLSGAKVSNTVLEDCVIAELELGEADLRFVRFPGCDIGDARPLGRAAGRRRPVEGDPAHDRQRHRPAAARP